MIEAMILTEQLPEIHLIVISVANINEVCMELTPEVEAAIPHVINMIEKLLLQSNIAIT